MGQGDASGDGRPVTFDSPGESRPEVRGTLFGTGNCGVVLVPGSSFAEESWHPQARTLAGDGRAVLTLDFTSAEYGGSDTPEDILGAVRFLREEVEVDRVVLVGASSGGYSVLAANALAEPGSIDGTVTIAHPDGVEFASDLDPPLLFAVSQDDDVIDAADVEATYRTAQEPKELVTFEGEAHAQGLFETRHADELLEAIRGFVDGVCG